MKILGSITLFGKISADYFDYFLSKTRRSLCQTIKKANKARESWAGNSGNSGNSGGSRGGNSGSNEPLSACVLF